MTVQATRTTPVGAILAVTHGTLLCDLDDLYGLLSFLLDRPVMSHQLPAAADAVEAHLRGQFPDLAALDLTALHMALDAADTNLAKYPPRRDVAALNLAGSDPVPDPEDNRDPLGLRKIVVQAWLAGLAAATGSPNRAVTRPDPIPQADLDAGILAGLAAHRQEH